MLFGILNIVFGALVLSPSFVAEKKRRKYANALSWAGIILLIWGIMGVVSSLLNIQVISTSPLYWILWIAGGITGLLMGIILVVNLLKRSTEGIVNKVLPYQRLVGIVAVIVGILQLFVTA
ncbi:MAG: hypothetical protein LBC19_00450 [Tannerella sp.]|jgi:hypothetical protein|nr:hypothetical protein [Tannerella sp.]